MNVYKIRQILEEVIDDRMDKLLKKLIGEEKNESTRSEMNTTEVSKYLNVSRQTVHNWIKTDKIRSTKRGNLRYFDKIYIESFREAMKSNHIERLQGKYHYMHPHNQLNREDY